MLDPQTPVARRRGLLAAYDDALADACRALGLPDLLSDIPDGVERELARLEVEQELVEAGPHPRTYARSVISRPTESPLRSNLVTGRSDHRSTGPPVSRGSPSSTSRIWAA